MSDKKQIKHALRRGTVSEVTSSSITVTDNFLKEYTVDDIEPQVVLNQIVEEGQPVGFIKPKKGEKNAPES